jgi:hypothetical protein
MLDDLKSQLGSSMHTVGRFLVRPITVKKGNVTLGLTESTLRAQAREEKRERVKRMRRDLFTLMEQHPESRQLMRHLDLAERTLRHGGLQALEKLPVRVIAKALAQMERLVWDWTPVGLAELRSRMAVMVKNRAHEPSRQAAAVEAPEPDTSRAADVTEVEHAEFEEMERSWAGRMPEGVMSAQATPATSPTA